MQVLLVDEAVAVLVDHVEGLLKLLDLGLVKHGKDIGRGSLWPLLGGLGLGPLAGHLGFRWVGLPCKKRVREGRVAVGQGTCLPPLSTVQLLSLAHEAFPSSWAPAT